MLQSQNSFTCYSWGGHTFTAAGRKTLHKTWCAQKCVQKSLAVKLNHVNTENRAFLQNKFQKANFDQRLECVAPYTSQNIQQASIKLLTSFNKSFYHALLEWIFIKWQWKIVLCINIFAILTGSLFLFYLIYSAVNFSNSQVNVF